ncbi:MAG: PIG-L family deacetylase [Patescibacteria group bacterium]
MNIYVSPHPDDAILSCGGRILNENNKQQVVINVFSKLYNKPTEWDKLCGNSENPMKKRVEEDKKILSEVGVKSIYLDFYDNAVYSDLKNKKRPEGKKELISKKVKKIIARYPGDRKIFFPSGVDHIDHQLISKIGKQLSKKYKVIFYEDLPYSIDRSNKRKECYKINEETLNKKIKLICEYKTQIPGFLKLTRTKSVSSFKKKLRNYHFKGNKFCENYD